MTKIAPMSHRKASIQDVAAGLFVVIALTVILKVGQDLLMPVIAALLAIYVVRGAARAMAGLPLLGALSERVRSILTLVALTVLVVLLSAMLAGSLQAIVAAAPEYEERFRQVVTSVADMFGVGSDGIFRTIRATFEDLIDVRSLIGFVIGSLGSLGSLIFMAILYTMFMLAERTTFPHKVARIFDDRTRSETAMRTIETVNDRVTAYLGLKTFINIVLGAVSYVVLFLFGVDFALLWALLIGLFNYIPYIGSYLGVAFPVILAIAQFGNIATPALLCVMLVVVQLVMGNVVEPKLMGRSLNISPFVILVALAVWSALWGIPGAILAVPLTSVIAIVTGAIPSLRWIAVLLAENVDTPIGPGGSEGGQGPA